MYVMHRESWQQFFGALRARTVLLKYIKRLQSEMKLGFVKITQPVNLASSIADLPGMLDKSNTGNNDGNNNAIPTAVADTRGDSSVSNPTGIFTSSRVPFS